jgi:hypothetical protein
MPLTKAELGTMSASRRAIDRRQYSIATFQGRTQTYGDFHRDDSRLLKESRRALYAFVRYIGDNERAGRGFQIQIVRPAL